MPYEISSISLYLCLNVVMRIRNIVMESWRIEKSGQTVENSICGQRLKQIEIVRHHRLSEFHNYGYTKFSYYPRLTATRIDILNVVLSHQAKYRQQMWHQISSNELINESNYGTHWFQMRKGRERTLLSHSYEIRIEKLKLHTWREILSSVW